MEQSKVIEKIIDIVNKRLNYWADYNEDKNYNEDNLFKGIIYNDFLIYKLDYTIQTGRICLYPKIYVYFCERYLEDLTELAEMKLKARKTPYFYEVYLNLTKRFLIKYSYSTFNGDYNDYTLETQLKDVFISHNPEGKQKRRTLYK